MLPLIVVSQACLTAQFLVPPTSDRYAPFVREYEKIFAAKSEIGCSVQRIPPRVTYALRHLSSFLVSFHAAEFVPKGNVFAVGIRVTPQGGQPAYLAFSGELPNVPPGTNPKKAEFQASGGFYLGEGAYRVDVLLIDGSGRACKKGWNEKVRAYKLPLEQAAGTVSAIYGETWKGLASKPADRRLTVFLHVAPIYRRRNMVKLSPYDRGAILQTLTGILDRSDFGKVRVIAFDLLGKRRIFTAENFDPAAYRRLFRTLEQLNYGTIDYRTLTQGPSDAQLLTELIREELDRPERSEAVMFLGAEGAPAGKFPLALEEAANDLPRSVYVAFSRFPIAMEDIMFKVVKKSRGKRIMLLRPQDLANAVKALASKS